MWVHEKGSLINETQNKQAGVDNGFRNAAQNNNNNNKIVY